jgi:hypothetical protein
MTLAYPRSLRNGLFELGRVDSHVLINFFVLLDYDGLRLAALY